MTRRLALAFFCAVVALSAADKPNLSGSWKLNASKSDFGPMPGAPDKFERKIDHADPKIKIATSQSMNGQDRNSESEYTIDGKENIVKSGMGEAKVTAKWEGATLVVNAKREVQGNEMVTVEKMSLSADGKTLTDEVSGTSPMGEFKLKFVFDKQ